MKSNKWYIQLPNNFYELPIHSVIQNQDNGQYFISLYLRFLLLSVNHDGYLLIVDNVPYDDETLANLSKFDISLVKSAISLFIKFGLMRKENDIYYMTQFQDYVKTTSTDRVRKHREKIKNQEKFNDETYLKHDETLHDVTSNNTKQNCNAQNNNKNKNKNKNNINITPSITPPREKSARDKKTKKKIVFPTDNEAFNKFWTIYPKKVAIARAYNAFTDFKCDEQFVNDVEIILQKQLTSYEWNRENGRYIPSPEKYIRESRFQDELTYTPETPPLDPETEDALDAIWKKMKVGGARYV